MFEQNLRMQHKGAKIYQCIGSQYMYCSIGKQQPSVRVKEISLICFNLCLVKKYNKRPQEWDLWKIC